MGRRTSAELIVILWRDIPAQVNGRNGDDRHQVILPMRFQKAIDRAAMVAGKKTAQEYVAEWRRTSHPLTGDLAAVVAATAATIEQEFTNERLHTLIDNGGWDPADPDHSVPASAVPDSSAADSSVPDSSVPHVEGGQG